MSVDASSRPFERRTLLTCSAHRRLLSVRKFLVVVALGVLAWIFVVPSCSTKFGCESAPATAHADDGNCPDDAEEAAQDANWARSRWATIKDRPLTVGLFYDDDGVEHPFTSGEGEEADHAAEVLRQVGAPSTAKGTYPAATHVEVKAAVAMRDADEETGVIVINHPDGPCVPGLGCSTAVPLVLPEGSSLVVWWFDGDESGMLSATFAGKG